VALVQGAGIGTAYPTPSGAPASQDRDFVGEGLGNLAGSFFQSMPTGGSLSRTGISVSAGSTSRWGFVTALFVPLQRTIFIGAGISLFAFLEERHKVNSSRGLTRTEDGR